MNTQPINKTNATELAEKNISIRMANATSIIVHRVPNNLKDNFIKWLIEINHAAQAFSGYKASEIYQPIEMNSEDWIIVIEFDNSENLKIWIDSPIRNKLLSVLPRELSEFKIKTLHNGFNPWFSSLFNEDEKNSGWKIYFIVLLSLYPTVMLLNIFVTPTIAPLGFSLSMLLSNAFSVAILQWILVPILSKICSPWLNGPHSKNIWLNLFTIVAILLSLAWLTALF